jgi:hypothetical protein
MAKLDMESVQDLVRGADIEGFLAEGEPADEYEPEEMAIFSAMSAWPAATFTKANVMAVVVEVWRKSFSLDDAEMSARLSKMDGLAGQFVHFFGAQNE